METIEVWASGTEVLLNNGTLPGIITGLTLRETKVAYEVGYWVSGEYKSTWFIPCELTLKSDDPKTITLGLVKRAVV